MTDHTNLIALLRASGGVIAGHGADALEALQLQLDYRQDRLDKVTNLAKELRARLTALEGQEPVAYLMTFGDGTTTIQKSAYWDSCISVDGLYLAAGASPVQQEPVAWRWAEIGSTGVKHWFSWTTDWEHYERARALGVDIEYALAAGAAPTLEHEPENEPAVSLVSQAAPKEQT